MEPNSMRSAGGVSTMDTSSVPASESGSSAISGGSNVQQSDPKTDKRISVGWHWTYGWLRRPEEDNEDGFAYEDPEGDMIYVQSLGAIKQLMLECREDKDGVRYLCLYHDR